MNPQAVAFILIFACAFVVLPSLALRYKRLELRHKERMTAFEKGIPLPPDPVEAMAPTLETYHLRGLIWLAAGIGVSLMLFIMLPMISSNHPNDRMFQEQTLKQQGYARDEIRQIFRENDDRWEAQRQRSRGVAALGIVPAAIGTAYLIFYFEQKKRRPVKME